MTWIVAYLGTGLAFGLLDALWLRWAGPNFYRRHLGDMLARRFRMGPALIFYFAYIAGIVWFAVRPASDGDLATAALNGGLLGALCYATYGLTNQAVLKRWSRAVTAADIAWGAFATAAAAAAGAWAGAWALDILA